MPCCAAGFHEAAMRCGLCLFQLDRPELKGKRVAAQLFRLNQIALSKKTAALVQEAPTAQSEPGLYDYPAPQAGRPKCLACSDLDSSPLWSFSAKRCAVLEPGHNQVSAAQFGALAALPSGLENPSDPLGRA